MKTAWRWVWRVLKPVLVWTGPLLVLLVAIVAGFGYWVVQTPAGTRWAVVNGVALAGGQASGVQGTVADGVIIDDLRLDLPGLGLRLGQARLTVAWQALAARELVVRELSAGLVDVDVRAAEDEPAAPEGDAPFELPALPVSVSVQRLAVGEVVLRQDGALQDWRIRGVLSALDWHDEGARLQLKALELAGQGLSVQAEGDAQLRALADPWPASVWLRLRAAGERTDSVWCARHHLPTLPTAGKVVSPQAPDAAGEAAASPPTGPAGEVCAVELTVRADGSLDGVQLTMDGQGQDMTLNARADVRPRDPFPVRDAQVDLVLPDGAGLQAQVLWQQAAVEGEANRASGSLHARALDLGVLSGGVLPPSRLSASLGFEAAVQGMQELASVALGLQVLDDTRWQGRPLTGHVAGRWTPGQRASGMDVWASVLSDIGIQLRLGAGQVQAQGALGRAGDTLVLQADLPELAHAWPDVPGGGQFKATLTGSLAEHRAELAGRFLPQLAASQAVGEAPVSVDMALSGRWRPPVGEAAPSSVDRTAAASGEVAASAQSAAEAPVASGVLSGWQGRVERLQLSHTGLGVHLQQPMDLALAPDAVAPDWQWQVGATVLRLSLEDDELLIAHHAGSRGRGAVWETAGNVPALTLAHDRIERLRRKLDPAYDAAQAQAGSRGGVRLRDQRRDELARIVFGLEWALQFNEALGGTASLRRVSGDIRLPGDKPQPLGLQDLILTLQATPQGADSQWQARLQASTQNMGGMTAQAAGRLRGGEGGLRLAPDDPITADVDLGVKDLAWLSLFVGDEFDLGGALNAQVRVRGSLAGDWLAEGDVRGSDLRVVRIDDGVRLLDGTLAARLEGDRVVVEQLRFPSRLRVEPKEWRTAEWVSTNPDAKDGYLDLTGHWLLSESRGDMRLTLHRYPILQRADRYAMMTGALRIDAAMPRVAITGELVADAGWIDLDILGGVPTLDGDVVVLRGGVEEEVPEPSADLSMQVSVDLGPRFYITGYGVNSGLVGKLDVTMAGGQVTAIGALRTRGGAIEAYGQRLQLRRGTITFQGDIATPLLDIEALRTNQAVQAGVRVSGSARKPRIDLVSYPNVSDMEKLTWFLLGRAPDQSGGDVALLLSLGSSLLTAGEPFYRQFGIDELTMRSGALGSTGSVLPADTVVRRLDSGGVEDERRYVSASRRFAQGFTVSVQQALSETGTVGRVSYRLMQGLTAELSVGTVNGLALIWRWFSND